MKRYKHKKHRTKRLSRIVVLILLAGAVYGGYYLWQNRQLPTTDTAQSGDSDSKPPGFVNLEPATETDKAEAAEKKKEQAEGRTATPPDASGKKTVTPTITIARKNGSIVDVRAYVTGVYEEGGTCTATFTKGDSTVTASAKAFQDATSTTCYPMMTSADKFSGTGWQVKVSYSSSTAAGTSAARGVDGL